MTENAIDIRRKQLLYRAQHRGFKEADLVIGGFAAAHLSGMSESELDEFEALIKFPDHDLYAWVMGNAPAPANIIGPVFEKMQRFDVSKLTAP